MKKYLFIISVSLFFMLQLNLFLRAADIAPEKAGPPRQVAGGVLFTFEDADAEKAYIAGSFNGWANNSGGKVTDPQFLMDKGKNGIWYKVIKLKPSEIKYKFVSQDTGGNFNWRSDPYLKDKDGDGNSILDLTKILATAEVKRALIKGRNLKPLSENAAMKEKISISFSKIWVMPGEKTTAEISIDPGVSVFALKGLSINYVIKTWDGKVVKSGQKKQTEPKHTYEIDTKGFAEGGYRLEAAVQNGPKTLFFGQNVFSVVKDISDDMRYGFYANWSKIGSDYAKKTDMLSRLYINAIEYYDYFPAHGYYAPKEKEYKYEPFGIKILGEDLKKKIDSAKERNILSIAYVAAYAASRSIYEKYPYTMTDSAGNNRIFNGSIMTEAEAKKQGKDMWFWLMAIAPDTKWYPYIMSEFARCIDDSPSDLVAFDGFEIDSYGHSSDEKYYSEGSRYSGELLSKVIMGLVDDVRKQTHKLKAKSAVSFNCVNEYGIEKMYDVTDFIFIENWSGFKPGFDDLVDICYRHREKNSQRVILKIYPADTKLGVKQWPADSLKLVLGATMTGAGSLMVAGEPDEETNEMHGLNTLYYPDNQPMPAGNFEIIKRYNMLDALLYRVTHGKNVKNQKSDFELPGCITKSYETGSEIIIQILHNGSNFDWSKKVKPVESLKDYEIAYKLTDNKKPLKVYYASPDKDSLIVPREIDFEIKDSHVRCLLPYLDAYGVLIMKY